MLLLTLITAIGVITIASAKEVNENFNPINIRNVGRDGARNYELKINNFNTRITAESTYSPNVKLTIEGSELGCGGIIYNNINCVITSAYCALQTINVVLFDDNPTEEKTVKITNIVINEDYDSNTFENNIAILTINNTESVKPIFKIGKIVDGDNVDISTFNTTIGTKPGTVSPSNCAIAFGETFQNTAEFCVLPESNFLTEEYLGNAITNAQSEAQGIISYFCNSPDYCKTYDYPVAAIRLSYYQDFLDENCKKEQ